MANKTRTTLKSDNAGRYTSGVKKWDPDELEGQFVDLFDSVQTISAKTTMAALDYDCAVSVQQEKALSSNSALTISNPVNGEFYTMVKTGAYTLTLPVNQYYGGGAVSRVVPAGRYIITFFWDGTNYHFNYSLETLITS